MWRVFFSCAVLLGVGSAEPCPEFEYAPTHAEINTTKQLIRQFIANTPPSQVPGGSHITACIVQLVFHDCVGGCDGCLRKDISANALLVSKGGCVDLLESVYQTIPKHPWKEDQPLLSRADFWVLAGMVAVEEAVAMCPQWGNNPVPKRFLPMFDYTWGRKDCYSSPYTTQDRIELPAASKGMTDIDRVFRGILEMNPEQFTALIGAHTLGHSHFTEVETFRVGRKVTVQCGYYNGATCTRTIWTTNTRIHEFNGPWTPNPRCFSNSFYKALLQNKYSDQPQIDGLGTNQPACIRSSTGCFDSDEFSVIPPQTADQPFIMLPSDLALVSGEDPAALEAVKKFALNESYWIEQFSDAFNMMTYWPTRLYSVGCTLSPTPSGKTRSPTAVVTESPTTPPSAPTSVPSFVPPPTVALPPTPVLNITGFDNETVEEKVSSTTFTSSDHGQSPQTNIFPTTKPETQLPTPQPSPPSPSTPPTTKPETQLPTPQPSPPSPSTPPTSLPPSNSPKTPTNAGKPTAGNNESPTTVGEGFVSTATPSFTSASSLWLLAVSATSVILGG